MDDGATVLFYVCRCTGGWYANVTAERAGMVVFSDDLPKGFGTRNRADALRLRTRLKKQAIAALKKS